MRKVRGWPYRLYRAASSRALGPGRFQEQPQSRCGDRVPSATNLEGLIEQLIGILDLPADEPAQRGRPCTVGFLGIGPGRAEE